MSGKTSELIKYKDECLQLIAERPSYTNKNVYEYLTKKYPADNIVYNTFR
jgi:hypothetical protein